MKQVSIVMSSQCCYLQVFQRFQPEPLKKSWGAGNPFFITASVCSVGGINNVAGFIYILAPEPDTLASREGKTSGWLQGER